MDKDYIKNLVKNKAEHIELKKAEVKHTNGGLNSCYKANTTEVTKGVYSNAENKLERTIIGNTYNWLDSHGDIHVKGCFTKSIKERSDKIFHLADHEFKITAKVGTPINIYEDDLSWRELGVDMDGVTVALHMDSEISKAMNSQIFEEYKNDKIDQHSVGMVYVKIDLAVNDEDYEEEFKLWNDIYPIVGNKEALEEQGYAWIVREAKLIEISCVLAGSNELTPTLSDKIKNIKVEGVEDITPNKEVEQSLQISKFYNNLKFIQNE